MDTMRRVEVLDDNQFGTIIFYVHKNAVHHNCATTISEWFWSSYRSLLSDLPTMLLRNEVMDFFGEKEQFVGFHKQPVYSKDDSIED